MLLLFPTISSSSSIWDSKEFEKKFNLRVCVWYIYDFLFSFQFQIPLGFFFTLHFNHHTEALFRNQGDDDEKVFVCLFASFIYLKKIERSFFSPKVFISFLIPFWETKANKQGVKERFFLDFSLSISIRKLTIFFRFFSGPDFLPECPSLKVFFLLCIKKEIDQEDWFFPSYPGKQTGEKMEKILFWKQRI